MDNSDSNKIQPEEQKVPEGVDQLNWNIKKILVDSDMPFSDKIRELSQNQELYNHIFTLLQKQGFVNKKLVLCTKVFAKNPTERNDYFFELEYKDLQELFSQFGKLERMFFRRTTASHMEAIAIFKDNVNAFVAQRVLDGYVLKDPNVILDIKFVQEKEEEEEDTQKTDFIFHCKYEVTITDPQFQTFRRLSGARDCNVLRLKDLASKEGSQSEQHIDDVQAELRYGDPHRYHGEKSDFIYLVVSAKTTEKYVKAASLSMELMANLFEEYKLFCDEKNMPISYDTRIKKYEYVRGDCPLIFVDKEVDKEYRESLEAKKNSEKKGDIKH